MALLMTGESQWKSHDLKKPRLLGYWDTENELIIADLLGTNGGRIFIVVILAKLTLRPIDRHYCVGVLVT